MAQRTKAGDPVRSSFCSSAFARENRTEKLREQLVACAECWKAMKEFDAVADEVIPELAPELTAEPTADPSFSQEKAEASFRKRLTDEKERERNRVEKDLSRSPLIARESRSLCHHFDRYDLWLPMAASALLCATLAILSYRTGRNHGIEWARLEERTELAAQTASAMRILRLNRGRTRKRKNWAARDAAHRFAARNCPEIN